ncbi:MAG TPA: hypothetical protein VMB70_03405 [Terriglobia bacterium]|nr:hypothetical protein [Terriglobia bacterium]
MNLGGNPTAIAITDSGPGNITTVFVTQFFAELNPDFKDPKFNGNGEARDLGKQGVVFAFPAGNSNPPITKIALKPLANYGFSVNRITPNNFCNTVPPGQSNIFCPDATAIPQGVFPNQLLSALIRGDRLFLPNIGAQPEPPQIFNANVQALVYSVDVDALAERATEHVNLNKHRASRKAGPSSIKTDIGPSLFRPPQKPPQREDQSQREEKQADQQRSNVRGSIIVDIEQVERDLHAGAQTSCVDRENSD